MLSTERNWCLIAQFARPDADTFRDNWEEDDGTTDALFAELDEVVADDADFIRTVLTPTNDVMVLRLSDVFDPLSSTGHILRVRYGKDSAGGDQIDLVIQLRQGYVSEGTPGTLIASATITNIPAGFTTHTLTLSGAEADSITNYNDLFVRLVGNKV
ncbi:MAG: hypothetical protein ACRCZI_11225 [Cetobacterium sp.]